MRTVGKVEAQIDFSSISVDIELLFDKLQSQSVDLVRAVDCSSGTTGNIRAGPALTFSGPQASFFEAPFQRAQDGFCNVNKYWYC